ncbi:MAG: nucleotidyltransferase domain-containing protein [Nanobdellota archaeon]
MNNKKDMILGSLIRQPLESKSMRQISIDTGLTYVTVHKTIPEIKGELDIKEKGKSRLIRIDLENAEMDSLSSAALYEKTRFLKKYPKIRIVVDEIIENLAGNLYSLILFGSSVDEDHRKDSDIDLLFIVPDRNYFSDFTKMINKAISVSPLTVDFKLITPEDFIAMLNEKYSMGREAFENGMPIFGNEAYYSMVKDHAGKKGY